MRPVILSALLLSMSSMVFAVQKTPPPPGPERPLRLPQISEKKLDNGLLVVVAPLVSIPKVTAILSLQVGNGARHQQQPGLPALAAETITEGTQTRTSRQIQEELRSMGATMTSATDDDSTRLTGSALSEFTEKYLSLMSDVVQHPSFPEEEVALAKQNTIQTILQNRADPGFLGNERLRKAIFGDHSYSFVVADKTSIEKMTAADLKEFVSDCYVPNNAHLILVGNIQPAEAFAMAQKVFGTWKAKEVPAEKFSDPFKRDRRHIYFVNRPGSVQSDISIGIATFPRKDPDYFAARTADSIFGGGSSSRLVQNIREKRGYTYSPFSINFTMARSGLFTVNAPVRNEVTGLALVEIFYELDRLRIAEPDPQELTEAKMKQNGNFSVELASQSDLANRINTIYTYDLSKDFIQTFRDKVNALKAEDVRKAAAKYFDSYRCAVVIVGDYEKVKDQVTPFGEVTLYDAEGNEIKK